MYPSEISRQVSLVARLTKPLADLQGAVAKTAWSTRSAGAVGGYNSPLLEGPQLPALAAAAWPEHRMMTLTGAIGQTNLLPGLNSSNRNAMRSISSILGERELGLAQDALQRFKGHPGLANPMGGAVDNALAAIGPSLWTRIAETLGPSGAGRFSALAREELGWVAAVGRTRETANLGLSQAFKASEWREPLERLQTHLRRFDRARTEAKRDPLAARLICLLDEVGAGRALAVLEQMTTEGAAPMLELLSDVLLEPRTLERFVVATAAADTRPSVKQDLKHGLDHLRAGETDHAFPPIIAGLEGLMRDVVEAQRLAEKRRMKRYSSGGALADALDTPHDHRLLVRAAFTEAHPGRHGAELDRKTACVWTLTALLIVLDGSTGQPLVSWLGRKLDYMLYERRSLAAGTGAPELTEVTS